jgi:hypothetical protein
MKWFSLSLICVLLGLSTAASGQATIERKFKGKPATDINVGVFTSIHRNCTPARLPVVRLVAPPAHGKVTVKQAHLRATNFKQCLGAELPAFVAYYRSAYNYIGQDVFTLEVVAANGKAQLQRITVTVMKPGSGQGI